MKSQLYLEQLVKDLAKAEEQLRIDINYRGMSFSQARLDDSQANVDRLHNIIQALTPPTLESGGADAT